MMVMGPRAKNRRSCSIQLNYLIHVQQVKPWPPSQSLKTLRSVLIQWGHGDQNSGSTKPVVAGEGRIKFSESFRLPVTLLRQIGAKGGDGDTYQKSCLDFNLYELRKDNTLKGQLLGTATVDLAEYGIIKETLSISVPVNSMRSFSNTVQPVLFIKIQPTEKGRISSSSRDKLSKEPSMQKNSSESVSTLMSEEYAEEAEIASITDDDVSSQSSLVVSSSAFEINGGLFPHSEENGSQTMKPLNEPRESSKVSSSFSSSTDSSSNMWSLENGHTTLLNFPETSLTSITKKTATHSVQSSSSSITYEGTEEEVTNNTRSKNYDILMQEADEKVADGGTEISRGSVQGCNGGKSNGPSATIASTGSQVDEKSSLAIFVESQVNREDSSKVWSPSTETVLRVASADFLHNGPAAFMDRKESQENGGAQVLHFLPAGTVLQEQLSREDEAWTRLSHDETRRQVSPGNDAFSSGGDNLALNILHGDRLKHVKSVRSPLDSGRSNGSVRSSKLADAQTVPQGVVSKERKGTTAYPKETRNISSDGRLQQLEHRIMMLEGELRDAAAIEVGLYSVVADHGSSTSKVHAPARRLSRLYLHACKESDLSRRANAARSAVSGLVLVVKACGNDVPRLTFWLSNSVVLRAIISQAFAEQLLPISARLSIGGTSGGKGNNQKLSSLQWKDSTPGKESKGALCENFDNWEDPRNFSSALEKIEAWIFSRIIESVWWQTLTPYMQPAAAKAISTGMVSEVSNTYQRTSSAVDQDVQLNLSLELWKRAFKDACERICPVRAEGHDCGCLPVLARLIMEQCVARLDVAMFNAILRESDDEIPTDPISDPISDTKVLPIPAGKASFGAGAQLKNAIGNWSRWLTDLFGIDDDDSLEDKKDQYNDEDDDPDIEDHDTSKSFHLLNALSDLMMLPKDMLLSRSIRKEVCPTFGVPLIKRVLNNFVPDEFCPDPIPNVVREALDSEDPLGSGDGLITEFPCSAASIVYLPPPAASVAGIIGETGSPSQQIRRSGSSVLKKSYTSDDELDELDSPLTSIIATFQSSPTPAKTRWTSRETAGSRNAVRYQLLREVWMNSK